MADTYLFDFYSTATRRTFDVKLKSNRIRFSRPI